MAEVAEAEGDKGLAREWLARGMRAPADPKWTADGMISDQWQPVSPVSRELGAFQWKVPVERLAYESGADEFHPRVEAVAAADETSGPDDMEAAHDKAGQEDEERPEPVVIAQPKPAEAPKQEATETRI